MRRILSKNQLAEQFVNDVNANFQELYLNGGGSGGGSSVATNPWYGKKYIACGDSITDPTVNTMTKKYCRYIAEALGMTLTNIGVSGSTMLSFNGTLTSGNGVKRSFVYELLNGNPTGDRGPTGIDWSQYDLCTLNFGVNDRTYIADSSNNAAVGSLHQNANWNSGYYSNLYEFYAAYEMAIGTILTANPNLRIVLCTPTNTSTGQLKSVAAAVREIGNKYSCPVIDFYGESGIPFKSQFYESAYTSDGVHPNVNGHKRMAAIAINKLLSIEYNLPELT